MCVVLVYVFCAYVMSCVFVCMYASMNVFLCIHLCVHMFTRVAYVKIYYIKYCIISTRNASYNRLNIS